MKITIYGQSAENLSKMDTFRTAKTSRLPRRFLTSWVRAKRPIGRPRLSTAHCISDTIHRADLDTKNWVHLANNRDEWSDGPDRRASAVRSRIVTNRHAMSRFMILAGHFRAR